MTSVIWISVCEYLESLGYQLSDMRCLDAFAWQGERSLVAIAPKFKSVDAWEINPDFEDGLKKNVPIANVTIGDSFTLATRPEYRGRYDFILIDAPLNTFGDKGQYSEHFQFLKLVPDLSRDRVIVAFNVTPTPFDYEQHTDWTKQRESFYNLDKTDDIDLGFFTPFYDNYMSSMGFDVTRRFMLKKDNPDPRYQIYLMVYCLVKL